MVTFFWVEPATGGDIIGGDNDWRLAIFEDSPFSVDFLSHLVEFLLKIHTEHAVCLVEDQVFQRAQIEPLGMVTLQRIGKAWDETTRTKYRGKTNVIWELCDDGRSNDIWQLEAH